QIASFFQGVDRLLRILLAVTPDVADLVQDLEAFLTVVNAVEDLALVRRDLLPIIALRVGFDQGFESRAVLAVECECLLEVIDRLLGLSLLALDLTETVIDVRALLGVVLGQSFNWNATSAMPRIVS